MAEKTWKRPGYKCAVGCTTSLVGNLKVKGTKDCILCLQLFGWWQQIDQIRQIRTFAFFTTCKPENLATYVRETVPSYLTQFLLLLSLKKWKLRRDGCDRIVWVAGAREISVVGGNRGRGCGFSGTLWPHTFLHPSSLLITGKKYFPWNIFGWNLYFSLEGQLDYFIGNYSKVKFVPQKK